MADARQSDDLNAELEWLRRRVAELAAGANARVQRLSVQDLAQDLLTPTRAGAADAPSAAVANCPMDVFGRGAGATKWHSAPGARAS